jgi:hypothetical protein
MGQHRAYSVDVDISVVGKLLEYLQRSSRRRSCLMARLLIFHSAIWRLCVCLLAKYSALKGQQGALTEHLDDSELSFIVTAMTHSKEAVHVSCRR